MNRNFPFPLLLTIMSIIAVERLLETFSGKYEIFVSEERKEKGKIYAKWTFSFIFVAYTFLYTISLVEFFLLRRKINLVFAGIGTILLLLRFFLKKWSVKVLGKYWSAHVEIRDSHQLIKTGPYRYLRHPAYLSNMIEVLGVPMLMNSWYTLFSVSLICIVLELLRIQIEEETMLKKFGEEYKKYKEETYAFFPLRKRKFAD